MRGGLDVPRDQPQQVTLVDQARKQLFDTGEYTVIIGFSNRAVQVVQPALEQARELMALWLAMKHRLEGLARRHRGRSSGVGELANVRRDPVELVEGQPP